MILQDYFTIQCDNCQSYIAFYEHYCTKSRCAKNETVLPRNKAGAELLNTVVCDNKMLHIPLIAASDIVTVLLVEAVDVEVIFV